MRPETSDFCLQSQVSCLKSSKMDIWEKWTKTSMKLQDNLFRRIDAEGNYFPHQPIYGFAPYRVLQYCEAYLLLSLLDEIHFDNFIDIGCAEGFYPRLVSARYGVDAYGVDLSAFGIHRMRQYYKLDGVCADAHALPIKDCSFDVVLCSNTMEHVSDPKQVVSELMRIARKYVFIGVPQALTQKEIDTFQPDFNGQRDLHVHIFDQSTLNRILPANYAVTVHYANSLPVLALNAVYKRTIGRIANCLPLVKTLLYTDRLGCKLFPRRTIHILGKVDLTEVETRHAVSLQAQRRPGRHGNIPDFILRKIHDLNRKELGSTVLKLGTDKSQKWKEFTVKLSEQNPSPQVSVSDEVLAFLACPRCKGDIALYHDNTLVCQNCGASYAIEDGIPIMYDL